jgi:hypothetical protein
MAQIKTTTGEMMNAFLVFQRLGSERLPIKGSYTVARILNRLRPDYEAAEAKRVEMVKELGTANEAGDFVIPNGSDNFKAFLERFGEVECIEVELDVPMLNLDHLGDDILIEPAALAAIEKFIAE